MNLPVWTRPLESDTYKWKDHYLCPKCDAMIGVECEWVKTVFRATLVSWCGCYTEEQYQGLIDWYVGTVQRMANELRGNLLELWGEG
jgi:hypothetical protein